MAQAAPAPGPGPGAGLYLHIPFCWRKCPYCDFVSVPLAGQDAAGYLQALEAEMALRAPEAPTLASVYVGGGTPTVLPGGMLPGVLTAVRQHFRLAPEAEVTVEANPGTISRRGLEALRKAGANRLSLGVQSFQDATLRTLGRVHNAAAGLAAAAAARQAGFANLSLDLIFGTPGEGEQEWRRTLEAALGLRPEHISAYGLSYEPGTPFHAACGRGELQPAGEELEVRLYQAAGELLEAAGYRHYEISNYALPGRESRHNLNYWRGGDYLGLGMAAHSYLGGIRWGNVTTLAEYRARLAAGAPPVRMAERLSCERRREEMLMTGLRLAEGVALDRLPCGLEQDLAEVYGKRIDELAQAGLLERPAGSIRLSPRGQLVADHVIRVLTGAGGLA